MKKLVALSLLCVLSLSLALGQEEEPIPPKRSKAPKFGFFAGFTPGWLSVNVDPINTFLVGGKGAPLAKDGVFLYGGAGSAYILIIPNLRVGGMGMGGSIKSTSLDIGTGIRRDAELDAGFGGVTFEYIVPLVDRLDLSLGIMLGKGGIDIKLTQTNGASDTWDGEQTTLGNGLKTPPTNLTRTLSSSFFVWVPSVSLEYAVLGYMGVRLGVSYVGMSFPSWQVDGNYDLLGVPSSITGKGVMVNAGLFLGTF